jgi:7-cyano-7-deazaguanine synthase
MKRLDHEFPLNTKALVICSGGMDSVVAATVVKNKGYDIELIHFQYGSRAETPEEAAIKMVAEFLEVPLHLIPMKIYNPKDSPLLRSDSTIAGGEVGAEFAHEWVPARNLVMLAMATAFAEARGIETIVLGNNLEEAGAYPDNEPEFINRFNDLLPFAVADGKRVRVIMPVGNLMKHEIVELGHEVGAPLHLTWSCYRAGPIHCGTCGPCFMRRTAFEINKLSEVIQYASNQ